MMHCIYIAAKFEMRPVLVAITPLIAATCHEILSSWLFRRGSAEAVQEAREDLEDLAAATLFILDTSFPGGSGCEVELGFALARGIPVWIVGPQRNIFHHLPTIRFFASWQEVLCELSTLEQLAPTTPER